MANKEKKKTHCLSSRADSASKTMSSYGRCAQAEAGIPMLHDLSDSELLELRKKLREEEERRNAGYA